MLWRAGGLAGGIVALMVLAGLSFCCISRVLTRRHHQRIADGATLPLVTMPTKVSLCSTPANLVHHNNCMLMILMSGLPAVPAIDS